MNKLTENFFPPTHLKNPFRMNIKDLILIIHKRSHKLRLTHFLFNFNTEKFAKTTSKKAKLSINWEFNNQEIKQKQFT